MAGYRLNPDRLRQVTDTAWPDPRRAWTSPGALPVSRRQLLAGAAVAIAGLTPAVKAMGAVLLSYELVREGRRVVFQVDGRPCWTVDPDQFSGTPRLTLEEGQTPAGERTVHLALVGARFPGTDLPADFTAQIEPGLVGPRLRLTMALGGFTAEAPFVNWLVGIAPLSAKIYLGDRMELSGHGTALVLDGMAEASLNPGWRLKLVGERVGRFSARGADFATETLTLAVLESAAHSIRSRPVARRTLVALERGRTPWPVWPWLDGPLAGPAGRVEARANHLDLVRLELGETARGERRAALVAEPLAENKAVAFRSARLLPGARSPSVRLPLRDVRVGVEFAPEGDEATVTAVFAPEPVRARAGSACTYVLGRTEATPPFELTARGEQIQRLQCVPAVLDMDLPLAGAMVRVVEFTEGTHVDLGSQEAEFLTMDRQDRPVRPRYAGGPPAPPVRAIQVIRPADLLVLRFTFTGFSLDLSQAGSPRWVREATPAYLSVEFPPQHIAEQFFPVGSTESDFADPTGPDSVPPIRHVAAAPSRLVFTVPAEITAIPHKLKDLLDWQRLVPSLASAVDRSQGASGTVNRQQGPEATETALEIPYRLLLSPDTAAGWAHSAEPHTTGAWAELWHTQLDRTDANLYALWTPDFKSGVPADDSPTRLPTRPHAAQRKEIVELTTDRNQPWVKPVKAKRLALSALGAWLDAQGVWQDPVSPKNTELWRQHTVMARDQVVRVVTKGHLYPFGHRAALDEIIERKVTDSGVAYLRYKSFLIVRQREVNYFAPDHPMDRRDLPFRTVEVLTERTPVLDDKLQVGSLSVLDGFWPIVGGRNLLFNLRTTDWEGGIQQFAMPLAFIAHTAATDPAEAATLGTTYAADQARHQVTMDGQAIAYAPGYNPPGETGETGSTSTVYETISFRFGSRVMETNPNPGFSLMFRPAMERAQVRLTAVSALTGAPADSWIEYYPGYVRDGFDDPFILAQPPYPAPRNPTETFALVKDHVEAKTQGDLAPLVRPSPVIKSLSRRNGASGTLPADVIQTMGAPAAAGLFLGAFMLQNLLNTYVNDSDAPWYVPSIRVELATTMFKAPRHIWGMRIGLIWHMGEDLFRNFPPNLYIFRPHQGGRIAPPDPGMFTVTPVPGATAVTAGHKLFVATYAVGNEVSRWPWGSNEEDGETKPCTAKIVTGVPSGSTMRVTLNGTFPDAAIKELKLYQYAGGEYYYVGALDSAHPQLDISREPDTTQAKAPTVSTALVEPQFSFYVFLYFLYRFDHPVYLKGNHPPRPSPGLVQPKATWGLAAGISNFDVGVPDSSSPKGMCFALVFTRLGINCETVRKVKSKFRDSKKGSGETLPLDFNFTIRFDGSLKFFGLLAAIFTIYAARAAHNRRKLNRMRRRRRGGAIVQAGSSSGMSLALGLDIPLPDIPLGMFMLENLFLKLGFRIPLDDEPLEIEFGLCDSFNPFTVRYTIFGGGGAFVLTFVPGALRALSITIEIGLVAGFSVAVASGRIYCFIGFNLRLEFNNPAPNSPAIRTILTGYVRAGGEFDVLGIVSASLTFMISLTYDFNDDLLWGVATLTIEISMLFFSIEVSWEVRREFRGSGNAQAMSDGAALALPAPRRVLNTSYLDEYCGAFAAPGPQEVSR